MNPADWIGRQVAGCHIEAVLGAGAESTLFVGTQQFLERKVAIKLVPVASADGRTRIMAEGRLLAGLSHPNIARIYNMDWVEGHTALVLEYIEGLDLRQRIDREGPLSPLEAAYIGLQVAGALEAAANHGVVHRDVKPANIMLTHGGVAKLVDFGLGGWFDHRDGPSAPAGTVGYRAPEQLEGRQQDARTDLYGLGATLWHALVGEPPPSPVPRLPSRLPRSLSDLVAALTAPEPALRPKSAEEALIALSEFLDSSPKAPWALIVEPDEYQAERVSAGCVRAGLTPIVCADPEEAVRVLELRRGAPRVSFVQLVLPVHDGMSVVREIARRQDNARIVLCASAQPILDASEAEVATLGVQWASLSPRNLGANLEERIAAALASAQLPASLTEDRVDDTFAGARFARVALLEATPPDPAVDRALEATLQRVASVTGVGCALVTLLGPAWQQYRAQFGLPPEAPRRGPVGDAICGVVVETAEALVINDAPAHSYFGGNAGVQAGAVRRYCGAPVLAPDGTPYGSVCAFDDAAQIFLPAHMRAVQQAAAHAGGVLQLSLPGPIQRADTEAQLGFALPMELTRAPDHLGLCVFDAGGVMRAASSGLGHLFGCLPDALVGLERSVFRAYLRTISIGVANLVTAPEAGQPYVSRAVFGRNDGRRVEWSAWPMGDAQNWVQLERFELRAGG